VDRGSRIDLAWSGVDPFCDYKTRLDRQHRYIEVAHALTAQPL
jgi:hypothetical protein